MEMENEEIFKDVAMPGDDPGQEVVPDVAQMGTKIAELEKTLKDINTPGYAGLRSNYDQLVSKHAAVLHGINNSGVGKVNEDQSIIFYQADKSTPDTTITPLEQDILSCEDQLKEQEASLKELQKDGEITLLDYQTQYLDKVDPIKEKLNELKTKKLIAEATKSSKNETQETLTAADKIRNAEEGFKRVDESYKDSLDKNTPLFKKMAEIYNKNASYWKEANYNVKGPDGSSRPGNPEHRETLIYIATLALEKEGIKVVGPKPGTNLESLDSSGKVVSEPTKNMLEGHVPQLVQGGIKNRALLQDINRAMNTYASKGVLEMDD